MPVISQEPPDLQALGAGLRRGLETTGFVILDGHGIEPALIERAYSAVERFFGLPEAEKLRVADFGITQFFFDCDDYFRMVDELAALVPMLPMPEAAGAAYGTIRSALEKRGESLAFHWHDARAMK